MHTAYSIHSALVQTFRSFVRWISPQHESIQAPALPSTPLAHVNAINSIATHAVSTRVSTANAMLNKPLRVVRVMESGQARTSVGRMVISGRMADVCAELDRLVACEASCAS